MGTGNTNNSNGENQDVHILFGADFLGRLKRMHRFYNSAFQKHQLQYGETATVLSKENADELNTPQAQDRIYQAYTQFYETSGSMLIFCGFMLLQPEKNTLVDLLDPDNTGDLDMFRTDELILQRMDDIISETIKWRRPLYSNMSDEKKIEHMEDGRYCLGTYQSANPAVEITTADQYYYQMEDVIFETFGLLINDLPYDRQNMKQQYNSSLPNEEDMLGVRAMRAAMICTGLIQNFFPGVYHDEYARTKEEFPNIDTQATKILEASGLMTHHNTGGKKLNNILLLKHD